MTQTKIYPVIIIDCVYFLAFVRAFNKLQALKILHKKYKSLADLEDIEVLPPLSDRGSQGVICLIDDEFNILESDLDLETAIICAQSDEQILSFENNWEEDFDEEVEELKEKNERIQEVQWDSL